MKVAGIVRFRSCGMGRGDIQGPRFHNRGYEQGVAGIVRSRDGGGDYFRAWSAGLILRVYLLNPNGVGRYVPTNSTFAWVGIWASRPTAQ